MAQQPAKDGPTGKGKKGGKKGRREGFVRFFVVQNVWQGSVT